MSLRYALLGVLEARPMTGYELAQFFDASTGWVWSAPHSNIYAELHRMQRAGLLSSRTETRGERLERTVYAITETGSQEFRDWVASDPRGLPLRDPMLLRAVFIDTINPDIGTGLLKRHIAEQEALIKGWEEHRDALTAKDTPLLRERLKNRPKSEHDRIAALKAHVFQAMIDGAEARVGWARRMIELVRDGP